MVGHHHRLLLQECSAVGHPLQVVAAEECSAVGPSPQAVAALVAVVAVAVEGCLLTRMAVADNEIQPLQA